MSKKHSEVAMVWTRLAGLLTLMAARSAADSVQVPQVVSTFVYTVYGDRTPFVLPNNPALTPLGAQQLYQAGTNIRARYLTGTESDDSESTVIRNISPYQIYNDEISISSTDEEWVVASAQAFLQGLYPPLVSSSNDTYISGQSALANGTNVVAPLDGYQYANIQTFSDNDPDSIFLQGSGSCPVYTSATTEYYSTSSYQQLEDSTAEFYDSLYEQFLSGILSEAAVGYYNAWFIADYLDYAYLHNSTVADNLSEESLTRADILAADWAFAMSTNTSLSGLTEGDKIGAIAGKTLAYKILESFYTTINTEGEDNKLTLAFGSYEPMIAFAALSGLISTMNAVFYDLPEPGASFIFELLAYGDSDDSYPSVDDLFVQFLYRDGTGNDSELVSYAMFGYSPSEDLMAFSDFMSSMEQIAISGLDDWCTTCASKSIFCDAYTDTTTTDSDDEEKSSYNGLHPAVAGAVGAAVTLVFVGLVLAAIMLFGGFRLQRRPNRRRSELGGFKGAEKLASDQDLTLPKGSAMAATANADAVKAVETGIANLSGRERVGSWELKEHGKAQKEEEAAQEAATKGHSENVRPSFENDDDDDHHHHMNPFDDPIKPHESV